MRAGASSVSVCDRGGAAEPAAGGERVVGVESRIVVGADGGGNPALGGVAVGGEERSLRHEEHVGVAGGPECRVQTGDAAADDDEVAMVDGKGFCTHRR